MDEFHDSNVNTDVWIQAEEGALTDSSGETGADLGRKILHFLKLYWENRRTALVIIGTGAALSVAYTLSLPNIYVSTASLMPPGNSSPYSSMLGMLTGSSSAASIGSEALGLESPGETMLGILQSRNVQNAMIARFDLMRYYGSRFIENARRTLKANTTIDQDRKSGIITISVTDTNAQFASKLAQGYIGELNRVMTENSTSAARRERIFLEGRLTEVKRDLDESSKALSQFSSKSKAFDIQTQAKSMVDAELHMQGELAEGRSQLAALRQTYSEDNYRVKAVAARNAELEREIDSLSGFSKKGGTTANTTAGAYPSAVELPSLGLTYYDLSRKVHVDEEVWQSLTKQYEIARVQEAKEVPTIQVLDEPNVPNVKYGPSRSIIVIACTFISFLLSVGAVLALSKWESMDAQVEPKKAIMKAIGRTFRFRRSNKPIEA